MKGAYFREERIYSFKCLPLLNAAKYNNLAAQYDLSHIFLDKSVNGKKTFYFLAVLTAF